MQTRLVNPPHRDPATYPHCYTKNIVRFGTKIPTSTLHNWVRDYFEFYPLLTIYRRWKKGTQE